MLVLSAAKLTRADSEKIFCWCENKPVPDRITDVQSGCAPGDIAVPVELDPSECSEADECEKSELAT
jgi:hypothetical protein